jgi:hypothetical protein
VAWKLSTTPKPPRSSTAAFFMVTGAEQYVSRLVVPCSKQTRRIRWNSHKDHAAKALRKLASPHLLASLSQLQKVIERAHRDYDAASEPVRRHSKKRCGGGRLRAHRSERGRPRADELRGQRRARRQRRRARAQGERGHPAGHTAAIVRRPDAPSRPQSMDSSRSPRRPAEHWQVRTPATR